jgi:hypothetical protein
MFKAAHHPKAFLTLKRNVQRGLLARTWIILILEQKKSDVKNLAQETSMSYRSVLYHLNLLAAENTLTRKGQKPYIWELTGAGQQRITDVGIRK